jgi:hypothetical protein
MPDVTSSVIERIDYDDEEGCLYVAFRNGRVYRYDGVPFDVYERLLSAKSKGGFYNRRVRNRYPDQLVTTNRAGRSRG